MVCTSYLYTLQIYKKYIIYYFTTIGNFTPNTPEASGYSMK